METQRVVVIQDGSREVSPSVIGWILHGFSLKPGDILTLLVVLHQANKPRTLSFIGSQEMGFKNRVDSSNVSQKIVMEKEAAKKEEYDTNAKLAQISNLYQTHQVEFKIEVAMGHPRKEVALRAAQDMKATWVILDRQMKKNRRYFLEKLSCGISRMKRNNIIEQLRGPKLKKINLLAIEEGRKSQVLYDEMVPGIPEEGDLFSIDIASPKENQMSQIQQVEQGIQDDKVSQVQELQEGGQDEKAILVQEVNKAADIKEIEEVWKEMEVFQSPVCILCKNRRPLSGWEREFTYSELEAATENFSAKNSLTEGGSGLAFKGKLENNLKIVVKQHEFTDCHADVSYSFEVQLLKKARHPNVVMLLGSCTEKGFCLLVYEYACNGSVSQHLSKHCPLPLTWEERVRVALGAAKGLNYLHENSIIHRSMRTSNILLTHDFEPLIGDYGILGLKTDQQPERCLGYLAPEYAETRKLSSGTDVYAFGIVLLELITGRSPTDKLAGGKSLLEWARPILRERKHQEILDPRIIGAYDEQQLYWMSRVTQKCLANNPKKRLDMDKVVAALECITGRKTCDVMEDISAVKLLLAHGISSLARASYESTSTQDSFSLEIGNDAERSRSLAFNSATNGRTSISRTSTGSRMGDGLLRAKLENRVSLLYTEMLN